MTSHYDKQYLKDSQSIINKYEITPMIESSDLLDTFYRDTLKGVGVETRAFEHEQPKSSKSSISKLNLQYSGHRSTSEPHMPDLFLGDLTPDPRSQHQGPLMKKYTEQIWHRKDDYRQSFKNDNDRSIHSKGINPSDVIKNKKKAISGFKERYKNFTDTTENITYSKNKKFDKHSDVLKNYTDISLAPINDNIDKNTKKTILNPKLIKSNMIESLTDHKIKIADYNKLLKQKNMKDTNIRKNKNKSVKDVKNNMLNNTYNKTMSQLALLTTNFVNKKKNTLGTLTNKFKISKDINNIKINKSKEHFKNNEIKTTELDGKAAKLSENFNKSYQINKQALDVRENISDFKSGMRNHTKGNNKENMTMRAKDVNDIITKSLRKSLMSNNINMINKGNNKESMVTKSKNLNDSVHYSKFTNENVILNKKTLNGNDKDYEIFNYKSKQPELFNNFVNDYSSLEVELGNKDKEKTLEGGISGVSTYEIKNIDDFDTDADFSKTGEVKKAAGSTGKMGSKFLFRQKEYENSMLEDDNINDKHTFNNRK